MRKNISFFVCFELASSQFPWYHLAAILEERVNNQSLVLFSCHLYHWTDFCPTMIKTCILSISITSESCLHSLPALHGSFPMSTWCRGFHSLAVSLSLRNPSGAFLLPFLTWISHWWTSFDFKGQKEILLLLSCCTCQSTVAQVMVRLLMVSICYTQYMPIILKDWFSVCTRPTSKAWGTFQTAMSKVKRNRYNISTEMIVLIGANCFNDVKFWIM